MSKYLKWLGYGLDVAKIALSGTPAGAIVAIVDEVVDNSKDVISNDSIVKTLESMAKSKGNDLTPGKIERINYVLNSQSIYYKHKFSDSVVELLTPSSNGDMVLYNKEEDLTFISRHSDFNDFYEKVN